jgi:hypothetical protein
VTGRTRVRLTGQIDVALPPPRAFTLFTASGERAWAEGWDPWFPGPDAGDTDPGVVFVTRHGGRLTTWIVVGCEPPAAIRYAQASPGHRAGIVSVGCRPSAAGTRVTVGYDLTALTPEANAELDRFAAGYPDFLAHWEQAIARAIA